MSAPHSHDQSVLTRRRLGVLATAAFAAGVVGTAPSAEAAGKYDLGTTTLHKGSRGAHVKALQKALNAKSAAHLVVDGVFGPATDKALRNYQKAHHLTVDGRCGPATRASLNGAKSVPKGWLLPVHGAYRVSSEFNPKRRNPVTHKVTPHVGIDLAVASGRRIYAVRAGTVTHAGYDPLENGKRGNQVTIDHGNGYRTMYEHLSGWDVKVGQKVAADQKIANSGNTGRSTGPHLHFGVLHHGKFVNPRTIIAF